MPSTKWDDVFSHHLIQSARAASCIGAIPYKWNPRKNVFTFSIASIRGKIRPIISITQFVLYNVYIFYLFVSWVRTFEFNAKEAGQSSAAAGDTERATHDRNRKTKRMALQYVLCTYSVPLVFQWNFVLQCGRHQDLWNRILHATAMLKLKRQEANKKGNGAARKKEKKPGFYKILNGVVVVACLVITMNLIAVLRNPTLPHMLTSLLPGVKTISKIKLTPLILLQTGIMLYQWITIYIGCSNIFTYISVTMEWIKLLKQSDINSITGQHFMIEYRKLQVLQNNFDYLSSQCVLHLESICIIGAVLSIYTGLRVEGPQGTRSLLVGILILVLVLSFFIKCAEVHEISEEVLQSWKMCQGGTLTMTRKSSMNKFLGCVHPIRVRVGNFFYADRCLVITIMSIVIDQTVSLLMAK